MGHCLGAAAITHDKWVSYSNDDVYKWTNKPKDNLVQACSFLNIYTFFVKQIHAYVCFAIRTTLFP